MKRIAIWPRVATLILCLASISNGCSSSPASGFRVEGEAYKDIFSIPMAVNSGKEEYRVDIEIENTGNNPAEIAAIMAVFEGGGEKAESITAPESGRWILNPQEIQRLTYATGGNTPNILKAMERTGDNMKIRITIYMKKGKEREYTAIVPKDLPFEDKGPAVELEFK